MSKLPDYLSVIEEGFKNLELPGKPSELYQPVSYVLSLGGKRFRPVLCLMSSDMFGGDLHKALPAALALEVFHNFTLVHDDLMDAADMRRGKPTVHKKWNDSTAVLSGDVMLVLAYDLLLQVEKDMLPEVIRLFNETAKRVCEGQQMDMLFETAENVSTEAYIEMIGLKTAALLAGCLEMGALSAGASADDRRHIAAFGYGVGTAFQVQDDLLDSFGDSESFGKKIGGDIAANKKTCLTLRAFESGNEKQRQLLAQLFGNKEQYAENEKIAKVLEVYKELGIKEYGEQLRDKYYFDAMHHLQQLSIAPERTLPLKALAEKLINRDK